MIHVSLSGGRSSAMMLKILLDNHPKSDLIVLFANTGKEHPKTIEFLQNIEANWNIKIHCIEFNLRHPWEKGGEQSMRECIGFKEVEFNTMSMKGEPYAEMIAAFGLPNRMTSFCTEYLKVVPMKRFLEYYKIKVDSVAIGIRYDEPDRYHKMKKSISKGIFPLYDMRVTNADKMSFWSQQPFDLDLPEYLGNCDLCFKKWVAKKRRILRDEPERGDWWAAQEKITESTFEKDGISIEILRQQAQLRKYSIYDPAKENQLMIPEFSCFCGD